MHTTNAIEPPTNGNSIAFGKSTLQGISPKQHTPKIGYCCLLACLLAGAAAKPSWSTLDTKKGYKTKTRSTSSVTLTLALTLIRIEYWDRAGGGGNISYDWCGTSRMIHTLMALDKVKSACK